MVHRVQGTSLRAVCARAGLSPRYFYESYADLDALLADVHDRIDTTPSALADMFADAAEALATHAADRARPA
ncbi:hypothetical protein LUW76_31825 [Actinomadura madurae]|uniref:hypothetical protein n=1 Tax=Actinomadura madurae TaxID=1993 RepID=UPI002025FFAB|nr:hypothetical protein [Actinomadura madurae]MCP9969857.1 hypothetical protein [Actinomadura madurae]URM98568.1 hypothetical protein LUW76_31825 [Actinomadura madurae]URN09253.1 hypothetical protein LUW74_41845 [Actinomadura madurae]